MSATGAADTVWVSFVAGAACWLVVFLMLPKPMWVYVFGHEATHAFWTWIFGGKVKRFKVTSKGGHVITNKSNFLIVLAPYFFPFYAFLTIVLFAAGHLLFGWTAFMVWFHLLLGAAYCFHLTLTGHILQTRQSDLTSQGYLFSAVVIWLGNLTVILLGVPLLTRRVSLVDASVWTLEETSHTLQWISHLF